MGEDDFIAAISPFAGSYAPVNYTTCSGQRMAIGQYQALFALIGNYYGPTDNSTYFTLPNLGNGMPVGQTPTGATSRQGSTTPVTQIGWPGGFPFTGATGGAATVPLVAASNAVTMQYCMCLNGIWPERP